MGGLPIKWGDDFLHEIHNWGGGVLINGNGYAKFPKNGPNPFVSESTLLRNFSNKYFESLRNQTDCIYCT